MNQFSAADSNRNVREAESAAEKAAEMAKKAETEGLGSNETKEAVTKAYQAALDAYELLNQNQKKYDNIIDQINNKIQQLLSSE